MNRYSFWWTTAAVFVLATDIATAAESGTETTLLQNTVCLNLMTFTLLVLLPSDDIVSMLIDVSPFDRGTADD